MARILVVDDDPDIGNLLEEALHKAGHDVIRAFSGTETLLVLPQAEPDLILLDLMLPGLDGAQVLSRIKNTPVIVVSAKGETSDKVALLRSGACDYITKPFSIEELLARVDVHLRDVRPSKLKCGPISCDAAAQRFEVDGQPIHLTPTEKILLQLLLAHPDQVKTKNMLLDSLMACAPDGTESSLKMHISNLRRKLKAVTGKDHIESVWGIGFRLRQ